MVVAEEELHSEEVEVTPKHLEGQGCLAAAEQP